MTEYIALVYAHEPAAELLLPPYYVPLDYATALFFNIKRKDELMLCKWYNGSWWAQSPLGVEYRMTPLEMAANGWELAK